MYLKPRGPVPPQRTDLWAWQPRRRASTDWGVCACAGRETRWGPPIRVRSGDGRWQAQPPLSKRTAGARRCLPDASPRPPCLVVGGNNRDRFILHPRAPPSITLPFPPPPAPPTLQGGLLPPPHSLKLGTGTGACHVRPAVTRTLEPRSGWGRPARPTSGVACGWGGGAGVGGGSGDCTPRPPRPLPSRTWPAPQGGEATAGCPRRSVAVRPNRPRRPPWSAATPLRGDPRGPLSTPARGGRGARSPPAASPEVTLATWEQRAAAAAIAAVAAVAVVAAGAAAAPGPPTHLSCQPRLRPPRRQATP